MLSTLVMGGGRLAHSAVLQLGLSPLEAGLWMLLPLGTSILSMMLTPALSAWSGPAP